MLTAILLRLLYGRVGSSLLMQLLASSDQIVCDRVMPYEHRYLAHFIDITRPRRIPWARAPSAVPSSDDWAPAVDLDALARCSLAALWQSFSALATGREPIPRYYAEKLIGSCEPLVAAGIPFRIIDVVRDPRDIYASARAFARRTGGSAFGLRAEDPESVNVALFLCDVATRIEALGTPVAGVAPVLVRYEDMIDDLGAVAAVLGNVLGVQLDPATVRAQADASRGHMTAASPFASVGRWRSDLAPDTAELLTQMLAPVMSRFGYSLAM